MKNKELPKTFPGIKRYRFFYHYNKANNKMTVHFRGECHITKNIVCFAVCETSWNKTQPYLTMKGWSTNIEKHKDTIEIF